MRRHSFVIWALVLRALVLSGCNVSTIESGVDEKYGVFTEEYMSWEQLRSVSPLMTLDETGSLNVCIEFPQPVATQDEYQAMIERNFTTAVERWNEMLNEDPPPDQGDFVFPPWNRATVAVEYTCSGSPLYRISADVANDRAYAEVDQRRIVLDADSFTDDGRLFNVLAHEYGHLMGLADTYTEPAIGLDVYGQPDSMMQTAMGFTEDDRAGIWNLWRYLQFGGAACGPGYSTQAHNMWGTYCIQGEGGDGGDDAGGDWDGGGCDFACADYGIAAGQCFQDFSGAYWECDDGGCLNRVYACTGGGVTADCEINCDWYGVAPGDCFQDGGGNSWQCDAAGCLQYVADCGGGDGGGACDYACADWGIGPGECFQDGAGAAWQCDGAGCLQYVAACEGGCEYRCGDYGMAPGQCAFDTSGYAWECDDTGCLQNVASCTGAGFCDYSCDLLGTFPGECMVDANGYSWLCDAAACLQYVASCW